MLWKQKLVRETKVKNDFSGGVMAPFGILVSERKGGG